ncbi:MAG: cation:proton antiporter [Hellea sp.]|nr:cation:proton antiporter [Hellea sp.]
MIHELASLAIIWATVLGATFIAKWSRLTPVLWFLFFGAVLVNTGLLPHEPEPFIAGLAELGILVIMFAIGFEEDTGHFITGLKKSWGIAFFGALAPFVTAFLIADYIWDDTNISLMCGLTMTATAVSLTMVSLHSEGLGKSDVATRIMTSALIDDIASLALVAILVPVATGTDAVTVVGVAIIAAKAVAFFILITILGTTILPHRPKGWIQKIPIFGKLGAIHLLRFGEGNHATLTVLLLAVLIGLLAHYFGFHPAVGAFMAGLILKEEYFQFEGESGAYKATSKIVDNIAFSWLGPIFFVHLGTKIIYEPDVILQVIPYVAVLTIGIIIAQVSSAALAARYTGGMTWPSSAMVGFGMLGRAELAFVVMDIAYVQNNVIPLEAFYTLMLTAFWLNVAVPVTIALWKPVYVRSLPPDEAA